MCIIALSTTRMYFIKNNLYLRSLQYDLISMFYLLESTFVAGFLFSFYIIYCVLILVL